MNVLSLKLENGEWVLGTVNTETGASELTCIEESAQEGVANFIETVQERK